MRHNEPKIVMAGQVPATHEHGVKNSRALARERTPSELRITAAESFESGAASRAIGCIVVMGGRDLPGHDDFWL